VLLLLGRLVVAIVRLGRGAGIQVLWYGRAAALDGVDVVHGVALGVDVLLCAALGVDVLFWNDREPRRGELVSWRENILRLIGEHRVAFCVNFLLPCVAFCVKRVVHMLARWA
jgi:hypothetical protein